EWCGDRVEIRSTYEYFFKYMGDLISRCSKKQLVVALSTCEVEYIAGALSASQVVCILNLLQNLKIKVSKHVKLMIENNLVINLVKNPVLHGRSKHCSTQKQLANVMIKAMKVEHFIHLRDEIGVVNFGYLNVD
ncbi:hypothetical protein KIW84_043675, partial [Lathyrus oleraceus]